MKVNKVKRLHRNKRKERGKVSVQTCKVKTSRHAKVIKFKHKTQKYKKQRGSHIASYMCLYTWFVINLLSFPCPNFSFYTKK